MINRSNSVLTRFAEPPMQQSGWKCFRDIVLAYLGSRSQRRQMMGVLAFFWSQLLFAATSPVQVLENIAQPILQTLKIHRAELKAHPQIIYRSVETYLLPQVDMRGMARSVLGRQAWQKASAQEKIEFTQVFTQLVIRTYATPLAKYHGETIRFHPIRGNIPQRFVSVESEIIRPAGPPIPLNYSLVLIKGEWKIYDLSVEGVSLLQSYRSQFEQILQQKSLTELIARLKNQAKS